jgi:copper chaperone CopZ
VTTKREKENAMTTKTQTTLNTHGIKCHGCATTARAAVEKLPGVEKVEFDLPGKTVTVTHAGDVARDELAEVLTKAGFPSQ